MRSPSEAMASSARGEASPRTRERIAEQRELVQPGSDGSGDARVFVRRQLQFLDRLLVSVADCLREAADLVRMARDSAALAPPSRASVTPLIAEVTTAT